MNLVINPSQDYEKSNRKGGSAKERRGAKDRPWRSTRPRMVGWAKGVYVQYEYEEDVGGPAKGPKEPRWFAVRL